MGAKKQKVEEKSSFDFIQFFPNEKYWTRLTISHAGTSAFGAILSCALCPSRKMQHRVAWVCPDSSSECRERAWRGGHNPSPLRGSYSW